jgi:outer membrane murein-binding lipoprotein Lpp
MADSDKVGNDKVGQLQQMLQELTSRIASLETQVGNDKVGQLQQMLQELTSRIASLETQVNASKGPITSTAKDEDMSNKEANISLIGGKRKRSRRHSRRGKKPRKSRRH